LIDGLQAQPHRFIRHGELCFDFHSILPCSFVL
jgi:hypothetical protein